MDSRTVALEGSVNFRDMGGYPTDDGRVVRWGCLFRSDALSGLTEADCRTINAFGLRTICDLRDNSERSTDPLSSFLTQPLNYWTRDYSLSQANLQAVIMSGNATRDDAVAAMIDTYTQLPMEQMAAYRELMRFVAAGDFPLIVNCSAGKDRTGLGVALVHYALGVRYDCLMDDYLLSNETYGVWAAEQAARNALPMPIAPDVARTLGGADVRYLEAAFSSIEQQFGSLDCYLHDQLGLNDVLRKKMQSALLMNHDDT